uniref:Uncharacterized protein n=1 Tax=Leersia perrieri TaxID=77586 RepID=A0A0D9WET6_9ORYZ
MAKLVNTAQRQLAADLASSSHRQRGSHTTVSSSSRRRARRAAAATRAEEIPPAAAQAKASRDPLYTERDARIRIEQLCDERRAGRAPDCTSSSGGVKARQEKIESKPPPDHHRALRACRPGGPQGSGSGLDP